MPNPRMPHRRHVNPRDVPSYRSGQRNRHAPDPRGGRSVRGLSGALVAWPDVRSGSVRRNLVVLLQKSRTVPMDRKGQLGYGDVWNYVAICRDCKLIPVWHVGKKSVTDTRTFIADLRSRLVSKVQLSTDAMNAYETAVVRSFRESEID